MKILLHISEGGGGFSHQFYRNGSLFMKTAHSWNVVAWSCLQSYGLAVFGHMPTFRGEMLRLWAAIMSQ